MISALKNLRALCSWKPQCQSVLLHSTAKLLEKERGDLTIWHICLVYCLSSPFYCGRIKGVLGGRHLKKTFMFTNQWYAFQCPLVLRRCLSPSDSSGESNRSVLKGNQPQDCHWLNSNLGRLCENVSWKTDTWKWLSKEKQQRIRWLDVSLANGHKNESETRNEWLGILKMLLHGVTSRDAAEWTK